MVTPLNPPGDVTVSPGDGDVIGTPGSHVTVSPGEDATKSGDITETPDGDVTETSTRMRGDVTMGPGAMTTMMVADTTPARM